MRKYMQENYSKYKTINLKLKYFYIIVIHILAAKNYWTALLMCSNFSKKNSFIVWIFQAVNCNKYYSNFKLENLFVTRGSLNERNTKKNIVINIFLALHTDKQYCFSIKINFRLSACLKSKLQKN